MLNAMKSELCDELGGQKGALSITYQASENPTESLMLAVVRFMGIFKEKQERR